MISWEIPPHKPIKKPFQSERLLFGTARLANTEPIMRLKLMIYAT